MTSQADIDKGIALAAKLVVDAGLVQQDAAAIQAWVGTLTACPQPPIPPTPGGSPLSTLAAGYARNLGPWPETAPTGYNSGAPYRRSDYSCVALDEPGKRLLFFGGGHGVGELTDVRALDLATLKWSSLYPPIPWAQLTPANLQPNGSFAPPGIPPQPCARHTYNGAVVVGGRYYILAHSFWGAPDNINGTPPANACNAVTLPYLDLATNLWTWTKTAQIANHYALAAVAYGALALVVSPWGDAWLYDPATDSAKQLAALAMPAGTPSVVHYPPNGRYYALYPDFLVKGGGADKAESARLLPSALRRRRCLGRSPKINRQHTKARLRRYDSAMPM
jgi:hypothetical protein